MLPKDKPLDACLGCLAQFLACLAWSYTLEVILTLLLAKQELWPPNTLCLRGFLGTSRPHQTFLLVAQLVSLEVLMTVFGRLMLC